MTAVAPRPGAMPLADDYEGEDSRFAIYAVAPNQPRGGVVRRDAAPRNRRRIAETSLDGIGVTLATLREDGDLTDDTRIGVFDRLSREWLVNPWARGDLR